MDTEQTGEIVEGSDPPQQETVMEKEVMLKMESPADVETPATTNGDGEQVNGQSEVENEVDIKQAETQEDPKMEENLPKDESEIEPASSPSDKDGLVADAGKEADCDQPEQDDKPVETPVKESIPEPAVVQEAVEMNPPKEEEEEKMTGNVEAQGATDVAEETEKKEEGKIVEGASTAEDEKPKSENEKPADEVKEKADATEAEVTAAAEEPKTEVKEQVEDPTPAPGSLAFAILEQEETKALLKTTRTLVVLRGLPGSGKSFLARAIADVYKDHSAILSASDHGVNPEGPDGYKAFDEAIVAKCSTSTSPVLVVVDDTNHTQDRLVHLGGIAKQHQLVAMFLEPRTEWRRDVAQLTSKTKRELEQAKLEAMIKPHEEMSIPLYFGWFLFPTVQDKVKKMAMDFLKSLISVEIFKEFLKDFGGKEGEEVDVEQYFKAKGTLHCTTKFTNYGKAEGAKEYAEKKVVQDLYGSVSDLSLTALFITTRTFGAKVSLTDDQLQLWPDDGEKEADPPVQHASELPLGSRAHITLGCAEGVQPVETGYDLLRFVQLQKEGQHGESVELDLGTLTYWGNGRWYLVLKEPVSAAACFSSFYKVKAPAPGKKEKKKPKCTVL